LTRRHVEVEIEVDSHNNKSRESKKVDENQQKNGQESMKIRETWWR